MSEVVGARGAATLTGLPSIRTLRSEDRGLVETLIRELSPLSRLRRFHLAMREASPMLLDRLVDHAGPGDTALLAVLPARAGDVAVGEARYAADADWPDAYEFALVVIDPWQRLGVGSRLLRELMRQAAHSGVRRLYGDTFVDNVPMLELARRLGFERRRHPSDARLVRMSTALEHLKNDMNTRPDTLDLTRHPSGTPTSVERLSSSVREIFATWLQRARDRHDLAHMSEWQLHDLGLRPDEIEREVEKPFWRV